MNYEIVKADINHADDMGYVHVKSWQAAYKGIVPNEYLSTLCPELRSERFKTVLLTSSNLCYIAYIDGKASHT